MKDALIDKIVELEWRMFSAVANVGGRAWCQFDYHTFEIMRRSQVMTWSENLLESWMVDLEVARQEGRNLMSEKYAWMMESTFPEEFQAIAERLPDIGVETLERIEAIVAANVEWKEEVAERCPVLSDRGRPIRTQDDAACGTSFETYLRGELKTYSAETIRILHAHTADQRRNGINAVAETLLNQVRRYGYASLAEAEKGMVSPSMKTRVACSSGRRA